MNSAGFDTKDAFARSASYPFRSGNRVVPLIDGGPAFRRICEAVTAAKHSVWLTVAFIHDDFNFPDGRGNLFDLLESAHARGLDVRVLFWRNNEGSGFDDAEMFSGDKTHRAMLAGRSSTFLARWDRAQKRYCQHQKSWIIDAGKKTEVAFVGGINLEPASVTSPGHSDGDDLLIHDIYLELEGPSATDVHHNFVQRWNEASERDTADGVWPGIEEANDLLFPINISAPVGNVVAQVQRTVRAGLYTNGHATPGGDTFDIASGEHSCFEQYERAIDRAQNYIYLENQSLGQPETVEALHKALERGVVVTVLTPADPSQFMVEARKDPRAKPFFDRFGDLGNYPHFLLAGITRQKTDGNYQHIYVHAKAGVIDDSWVTIGSCNIGARSFFGDTELNVSFVGDEDAKSFRSQLFAEHIGRDIQFNNGTEACMRFQDIARKNTECIANGKPIIGLVFALDPKTYGA